MSDTDTAATFEAVRDFLSKHGGPRPVTIGALDAPQVVALPDGLNLESLEPLLEPFRKAPLFRKGEARFTSIASFIEHVKRFADEHSVVFANDDRHAPKLLGVLDYHEKTAGGAPRFGRHRSSFAFPLSDEWKAWTAADGKPFKMAEFAAFLEDRIIDVLEVPKVDELADELRRYIQTVGGKIAAPNVLMGLALNLKVHEKSAVGETVNLSSGEGQISFVAEHTDERGAPLKVPSLFLIGLPVFKSGDPFRLAARLRYRKTEGGLVFWFDLWRADRVFDVAFAEACAHVGQETGLPVLFGSPE